jgi:hypothetical protein
MQWMAELETGETRVLVGRLSMETDILADGIQNWLDARTEHAIMPTMEFNVVVGQTRYQVIDTKTKEIRGTYTSRTRATRRVDQLDNEYGGYIHTVCTIHATV